jgi:hypothetical protein
MTDLKHLVSPFVLVPSDATTTSAKKATPRHAPPCNCDDSDEENDFGMAPECAFICNGAKTHSPATHKKSKKRRIRHAITKTKRTKQ